MRTVRLLGGVWQTPPSGRADTPRAGTPLMGRPHSPWTESQTGVKTLTCRNYVADGKKLEILRSKNSDPTTELYSCLAYFYYAFSDWMKNMIGRLDLKMLDMKMFRCRVSVMKMIRSKTINSCNVRSTQFRGGMPGGIHERMIWIWQRAVCILLECRFVEK